MENILTVSEIIQICILIASLGVFYSKMVRAFDRIVQKVDRHDKILFTEKGEVDVLTYRGLSLYRESCPNTLRVNILEHDVGCLKERVGI